MKTSELLHSLSPDTLCSVYDALGEDIANFRQMRVITNIEDYNRWLALWDAIIEMRNNVAAVYSSKLYNQHQGTIVV